MRCLELFCPMNSSRELSRPAKAKPVFHLKDNSLVAKTTVFCLAN
jgi:hypothetical protein